VLSVGVALFAPGCDADRPAPERSVILVTLDTTRADRIGAFGGSVVPTPHLDRVAREGVIFEEALSQVPLTLPAHASLMTGRYPGSLGVRHNGIYRVPDDAVTLAEHLAGAGFTTAGFVPAYVLNRGFGLEQGFGTFDDVPVNRFQGGEDQLYRAERTADQVNRAVFEWLPRHRAGRRFLWVHYYDPHDPYEPPEKPGRRLRGSGYEREISYVDACFGELIDRLDREGWLDQSILVVAGDHGESLGEHGERTHGLFLYDGALRVPLILRAPGLVDGRGRVRGPVELVDVGPTIVDLLGLAALPGAEGRTLRPRIEGRDPGRVGVAHAETLMPRLEFGWSELYMVRDERFKYVRAPDPELYDLRHDPGERTNLASEEPELTADLAALLDEWLEKAGGADAPAPATRSITPEEQARLRSLGYLAGDAFRQEGSIGGERPDPKRMIAEIRELDQARDRLDKGQAAEALGAVDRILDRNPLNHQARTTRVLALIRLGRLAGAEHEALGSLAAAQSDPWASRVLIVKARGLLASVYYLQGKLREAEEQHRRILELDPRHGPAQVDLARVLLDGGRAGEARALIDRVLEDDPRNGLALAMRFRLLRAAGDGAGARQTAAQLADQRAGDPAILIEAGRLLLDEGEPRRAAACFETALEQADRIEPEWLGQLGLARMRAGDLVGARTALEGVRQLRPADPRPPRLLGELALREGKEQEARAHFRRALELGPRSVAPLVSLARWLVAEGRAAEAEQVLYEALARNPGDAEARQELRRLRAGGARRAS
jgi:arylsulfatase A-like enzyme/predicted Zn-dependent protease